MAYIAQDLSIEKLFTYNDADLNLAIEDMLDSGLSPVGLAFIRSKAAESAERKRLYEAAYLTEYNKLKAFVDDAMRTSGDVVAAKTALYALIAIKAGRDHNERFKAIASYVYLWPFPNYDLQKRKAVGSGVPLIFSFKLNGEVLNTKEEYDDYWLKNPALNWPDIQLPYDDIYANTTLRKQIWGIFIDNAPEYKHFLKALRELVDASITYESPFNNLTSPYSDINGNPIIRSILSYSTATSYESQKAALGTFAWSHIADGLPRPEVWKVIGGSNAPAFPVGTTNYLRGLGVPAMYSIVTPEYRNTPSVIPNAGTTFTQMQYNFPDYTLNSFKLVIAGYTEAIYGANRPWVNKWKNFEAGNTLYSEEFRTNIPNRFDDSYTGAMPWGVYRNTTPRFQVTATVRWSNDDVKNKFVGSSDDPYILFNSLSLLRRMTSLEWFYRVWQPPPPPVPRQKRKWWQVLLTIIAFIIPVFNIITAPTMAAAMMVVTKTVVAAAVSTLVAKQVGGIAGLVLGAIAGAVAGGITADWVGSSMGVSANTVTISYDSLGLNEEVASFNSLGITSAPSFTPANYSVSPTGFELTAGAGSYTSLSDLGLNVGSVPTGVTTIGDFSGLTSLTDGNAFINSSFDSIVAGQTNFTSLASSVPTSFYAPQSAALVGTGITSAFTPSTTGTLGTAFFTSDVSQLGTLVDIPVFTQATSSTGGLSGFNIGTSVDYKSLTSISLDNAASFAIDPTTLTGINPSWVEGLGLPTSQQLYGQSYSLSEIMREWIPVSDSLQASIGKGLDALMNKFIGVSPEFLNQLTMNPLMQAALTIAGATAPQYVRYAIGGLSAIQNYEVLLNPMDYKAFLPTAKNIAINVAPQFNQEIKVASEILKYAPELSNSGNLFDQIGDIILEGVEEIGKFALNAPQIAIKGMQYAAEHLNEVPELIVKGLSYATTELPPLVIEGFEETGKVLIKAPELGLKAGSFAMRNAAPIVIEGFEETGKVLIKTPELAVKGMTFIVDKGTPLVLEGLEESGKAILEVPQLIVKGSSFVIEKSGDLIIDGIENTASLLTRLPEFVIDGFENIGSFDLGSFDLGSIGTNMTLATPTSSFVPISTVTGTQTIYTNELQLTTQSTASGEQIIHLPAREIESNPLPALIIGGIVVAAVAVATRKR